MKTKHPETAEILKKFNTIESGSDRIYLFDRKLLIEEIDLLIDKYQNAIKARSGR